MPMTVERMSVASTSDIFTLVTPLLVQSPASSISSATSISSFDLDDGERMILVADIGDPLPQRFSRNLAAWFDSVAPASNVAAHDVYNAKVFEYVELANFYIPE